MISRHLRPLVLVSLPLLLLLPSRARAGANRMQDCLAELSIRGGISAPDVVSEGDPFFHHVSFYGRDEKENVYYGEPLFFLFRPAHGGGTLRFDLHVGRRMDRSFYGGRFRVRFGTFETERVNVSIERDPERLSLLDADSKVLWSTYKAPLPVTMTIPPGEEAVPIQAEMPDGGTFFLTGLRFEPTPRGCPGRGATAGGLRRLRGRGDRRAGRRHEDASPRPSDSEDARTPDDVGEPDAGPPPCLHLEEARGDRGGAGPQPRRPVLPAGPRPDETLGPSRLPRRPRRAAESAEGSPEAAGGNRTQPRRLRLVRD